MPLCMHDLGVALAGTFYYKCDEKGNSVLAEVAYKIKAEVVDTSGSSDAKLKVLRKSVQMYLV